MKLSIITATVGQTPELNLLAKALGAVFGQLDKAPQVEWLLAVDKKLVDGLEVPGFKVSHVEYGKGHPYNAALKKASGDYVLFLDDCNVPTSMFALALMEVVTDGNGFCAHRRVVRRIAPWPKDSIIRRVSHLGPWREVEATTVAGPCWGAPKRAFDKVKGFDERYQNASPQKLDLCTRLHRAGVEFWATGRACVATLRESLGTTDPRQGYELAKKNEVLYAELLGDHERTVPGGLPEKAPAPEKEKPVELPPIILDPKPLPPPVPAPEPPPAPAPASSKPDRADDKKPAAPTPAKKKPSKPKKAKAPKSDK